MTKFPEGRPTHCGIDHAALRWNLGQIKKTIGPRVKILSMVKANAYGHGAVEVARTLAKSGSDAFGVATVEEGIELRRARIRQAITARDVSMPTLAGDLPSCREVGPRLGPCVAAVGPALLSPR